MPRLGDPSSRYERAFLHRVVRVVLTLVFIASGARASALAADLVETLAKADAFFAERDYWNAGHFYEWLLDKDLADRDRVWVRWAECYERSPERLRSRLDHVPDLTFPWNARWLFVTARAFDFDPPEWRAPRLAAARALFAEGGSESRAEWIETMLAEARCLATASWGHAAHLPRLGDPGGPALPDDGERLGRALALLEEVVASGSSNEDVIGRALYLRASIRLAATAAFPPGEPIPGVEDWLVLADVDPVLAAHHSHIERRAACIRDAVADLADLVRRFPDHALAGDALLLLAETHGTRRADLSGAAEALRELVRLDPPSPLASNGFTETLLSDIEEPSIRPFRQSCIRPDEPIRLWFVVRNVTEWEWEVRAQSGDFRDDWSRNDWSERSDSWPRVAGGPVSVEERVRHAAECAEVIVPPLSAGLYLLILRSGAYEQHEYFLVSNLELHLFGTYPDLLAWVFDSGTGAPVADAEVCFAVSNGSSDEVALGGFDDREPTKLERGGQSRTNLQGLASWTLPHEIQARSPKTRLWARAFATAGGESAICEYTDVLEPIAQPSQAVTLFESSRPLYEPGDRVGFLVHSFRYGEEARLEPHRTPAWVRISSGSRSLFSGELAFDDRGAATANFDLPLDCPAGVCTVDVAFDRVGAASSAFVVTTEQSLDVVVDLEHPNVVPGEPSKVTVSARDRFGKPVAGASVQVTLDWHFPDEPLHTDFEGRPWWITGPPGARATFGSPEKHEGNLDPEGRFEFTIPAWPRWAFIIGCRVRANVTTPALRSGRAEVYLPAMDSTPEVALEIERRACGPGESIHVRVHPRSPNQVAWEGTLEVSRREHLEPVQFDAFNDQEREVVVSRERIRVAPPGIDREITQLEPGEYEVALRTLDGSIVRSERLVFLRDPSSAHTPDALSIVTDARSYGVDDPVDVFIETSEAAATVLVLRSAAGQTLETRVVTTTEHLGKTTFRATAADSPNSIITATCGGSSPSSISTEILVEPTQRLLRGRLEAREPDADGLVEITLSVSNHRGEPVSGVFSLRVFDRSLLDLDSELSPPLRQLLLRDPRRRLRHANSWPWVGGSSWRFHAGDHGIGFTGYVSGVSAFREPGGPLGFLGLQALDHDIQRRSPALQSRLATVNRAWREQWPTGRWSRVEPEWYSYEKPRLDLFGARVPEPTHLRHLHRDLPNGGFWEPRLQTDARGNATVRAELPKSVSGWIAIARGVTSIGEVLETRLDLPPDPLVATLIAPSVLRQGDEFALGIRVAQVAGVSVGTDATLTVSGGALEPTGDSIVGGRFSERSPTSFSIEARAKADGGIELWVPVRASAVGRSEVVLTAVRGTERITEKRTVETQAPTATLSIGALGVARPDASGEIPVWTFALPAGVAPESVRLLCSVAPSSRSALLASFLRGTELESESAEEAIAKLACSAVARRLYPADGHERASQDETFGRLVRITNERLLRSQNPDGSWGWFPGDPGDREVTTRIVEAAAVAREAGAPIASSSIERATKWLADDVAQLRLLVDAADYGPQEIENGARTVFALARAARLIEYEGVSRDDVGALVDGLAGLGELLPPSARALAALSIAEHFGADGARLGQVLSSLRAALDTRQRLEEAAAQTDSPTHALSRILEVTAIDDSLGSRGLVTWDDFVATATLTADTAWSRVPIASALLRLRNQLWECASGEVEVSFDGSPSVSYSWQPGDSLARVFAVGRPDQFTAGQHTVSIRNRGLGSFMWSARVSYAPIRRDLPAIHEGLSLHRSFERVVVDGDGRRVGTSLIDDEDDPIQVGDRIRVVLVLETETPLGGVVIEDTVPSIATGLRPTDLVPENGRVRWYLLYVLAGSTRIVYEYTVAHPGRPCPSPAVARVLEAPWVRGVSATADWEVLAPVPR
ncbi:MAG: hypothetical protein AB7O52_11055 [Planctomycetota bacterium]